MTKNVLGDSARVLRNQKLILFGGGGIAFVGILGLLYLSEQGGSSGTVTMDQIKTTQINTPGSDVLDKDIWMQKSEATLREMVRTNSELEQKMKSMEDANKTQAERMEALQQELSRLQEEARARDERASIPPPPPPGGGSSVPPPAPSRAMLPPAPPPASAPGQVAGQAPKPFSGIMRGEIPMPAAVTVSTEASGTPGAEQGGSKVKKVGTYLPSGSFVKATLLGGLDAPTGGQAQDNPHPLLLRLTDNARLPNRFRARVKECFVIGAGHGDISSERAYVRTETLSCVMKDGTVVDQPVKGYVVGEDGKAGIRGKVVSKQGAMMANALLAGVVGGIGTSLAQSATSINSTALGTTTTVDPNRSLEYGAYSGTGKAMERMADYYIKMAEKTFPIIEIAADRDVDVVFTKGIDLDADVNNNGQGTGRDGQDAIVTERDKAQAAKTIRYSSYD